LIGLGGPLMEREGVELLAGLDPLAVMGFTEIVGRLEFFRELERRLVEELWVADLVVAIDYPGFNMRIARAAHEIGCPVLYYIAPKVWASRPGRAKRLAEVTDRVAVIFPFEVEILEQAGATVEYVGNPLLERTDDVADASTFHETWGLDRDRPILAILPGSRKQEIARHLDLFCEAAERVCRALPDVQPVISKATTLPKELFDHTAFPVVEDTRALLRHARAGLVKSGTSTLEAALESTPLVVAYRMAPLSWEIVKRMLRVKNVSLTNLVAGADVVPELLQYAAVPERMAELLVPLFDDASSAYRSQIDGLSRIRSLLGTPGASERVAELGIGLLEARS
jgi:lipid-A-disaccharide synthase